MTGKLAGGTAVVESTSEPSSGTRAKQEASLFGWFGSIKYMAAIAGVFAGIWALFPSYYTQGYLQTLNVPATYFPLDAADTPVTLHRVLISVLTNFLLPLPDHPVFMVIATVSALSFTIYLWRQLHKPKDDPSGRAKAKWHPSAAVMSVGGGIWLALFVYLIPRVLLIVAGILLLLPYVAGVAGQKDAKAVLEKRGVCTVATAKKPLGCVVIRYETKELDGKERVVDLAGVIVAGNSKWLAVLTADDIVTVPANVLLLTSRLER